MIKEILKKYIVDCVNRLINEQKLSALSLTQLPNMGITRSKDARFGDFATNVAMLMAKGEKKNPRDVALIIASELAKNTDIVTKVEVAGPGFINLTLSPECLGSIIPTIAKASKNYGKTVREPAQSVLVEFVSANPTGGLHLGHARGAFVGDALARLFEAAGYKVTREFYVNDAGNQIETLARTIHKRYRELFGESVTIEKGEYPGEYVIDIAKALKNIYKDKWLNQEESLWLKPIAKFGIDYNLALIKRSLANVDINIDSWFMESSLHEDGSLDALIKAYEDRSMLYEAETAVGTEEKVRRDSSKAAKFAHLQEGGWYLKTSLYGDDEDRIIKRRDGRFVYLTADLAYHHEKYARGFIEMINVFGADHSGHIGRLKAGMEALGHDPAKLRFAVVQMVRLLRDGKELKFSKRSGEVIGLEDLIDEVGKDVSRFVFLMRSPNSQFDLDIDILSKESQDNPVFYVQYGHARMATILKKAEEKGISIEPQSFGIVEQEALCLPEERELLLKTTELAEVVQEALLALEPHRLIFFCQDLIRSFHSYFTKYRHSEKIISDDVLKTKARLALVFALKTCIANALSFLGLTAPDYMNFADQSDA
jgi:arginyl-tRNA synthetase